MKNYILEGKTPVVCDDLLAWALWFGKADRRVKKTKLPDDVEVSTVFLGTDYGFGGEILLFETMIFGGEHDGEQWRYATWDEAEKGHDDAVKLIFA